MLTLEKCRELLGDDAPETPIELEKLRDALYSVASVVVDAVSSKRMQDAATARQRAFDDAQGVRERAKPEGFTAAIALLSEPDRYDVEERAAIHEFDGELDREAAERVAVMDYWRRKHFGN